MASNEDTASPGPSQAAPVRDAQPAFIPSVSTTGLSDSPATADQIGFAPYVRAVHRFLTSHETKAPLTLSIEGRWGSGKSSFMLQLAQMLKAAPELASTGSVPGRPSRNDCFTVWFNAWRFDKDETLWASFALVLIEQLQAQVSPWRRLRANAALIWQRFDLRGGKWTLLQVAAFVVAFGGLLAWGVFDPASALHRLKPTSTDPAALGTGIVALAGLAFAAAKRFLGNPLQKDLRQFVRDPGYGDKATFGERFQQDFARILKSYAGTGRVYVFIDDLDRAEVPRATELMQAINLLMSSDLQLPTEAGEAEPPAKLFFVLGIDRQVIAAGIAARNEKLVPYVVTARSAETPDAATMARRGVDYGYEFLEKFIQVSFRVPQLETAQLGEWVASITHQRVDVFVRPASGSASPSTVIAPPDWQRRVSAGGDLDGFANAVALVTGLLGFNPRRIKQFINVLRLQLLVLIETGSLAVDPRPDALSRSRELNLERVTLASAILMKWPVLVRDLAADPSLLSRLSARVANDDGEVVAWWRGNTALVDAVKKFGDAYSLEDADLRPLLELVPDAVKGRAVWSEPATPSPESPPPPVPGARATRGEPERLASRPPPVMSRPPTK